MNYYDEIKNTLIKNEAYKKVKDYYKNKNELTTYYEVGRLLIEAQGGEKRAKYGDGLIKKYSKQLTLELGKGYSTRNLKHMRKFYLFCQKGQTVSAQLTWSHYTLLLSLKNIDEINYYINVCETNNLSVRQLKERIKANEYERIPHKEDLPKPKVNTKILNPIIIHTNNIPDNVSEYTLHEFIMNDMDNFLKQLGEGFTYHSHEYKININNRNYHIDFLLHNYIYNCFVVVEVKVRPFKPEDIGQVLNYINYVDNNLKLPHQNSSFGIIVCMEGNEFTYKLVKQPNIDITNYELVKS